MKQRMRVLTVSGLSLQRGDTLILDNVSWDVTAGQHWAILGANGSGKTSLLSALTGYVSVTTGEIAVLGEHYGQSDWRELRKHIGLVSSSVRQMMADDEPVIESVISGKYAMIDFWGRPTRADRVNAKRILRQIECLPIADRPWSVLSQGERQRVLIGRALMAQKIWDNYDKKIPDDRREPLGIAPIDQLSRMIVNRLLDPETGFPPEMRAILRTKLRLPAEEAPLQVKPVSTNSVSTNGVSAAQ